MQVTVITAALPERAARFLPDAIASVEGQTFKPAAHLVGFDYQWAGTAATRNTLADAARTDWLAILDDDDTLYPAHLEELTTAAEITGADVVYSDWDGHVPAGCHRDFDSAALRARNFIPCTALIRRAAFLDVGGYPSVHGEDWALWLLLDRAGATFARVPRVTWTYRRHDGWSKQNTRPKGARAEALRVLT